MAKALLRCDICEKVTGHAETPCKFYPNSNVISKYEDEDHKVHVWPDENGGFWHVCFDCYPYVAKVNKLLCAASKGEKVGL
jgi:hypothetical protein